MQTLGTVVVVALAVALLMIAVLLVRSRNPHPWPAIVAAMLTSGICYTVGGGSGENDAGPSVATVIASIVGFLSVRRVHRSDATLRQRSAATVADHAVGRRHRPRRLRPADQPGDRLNGRLIR